MPIDRSGAPPPKKTASRGPGRPSTAAATATLKEVQYTETVTGLFQAAGMLCVALNQPADAMALGDHAPNVTPVLAKTAAQHEEVGKILDLFNKAGGPWLTVGVAVLPLLMQLAANHKMMKPAPQLGVMPREVMEARGKAEIDAMMRQAEEVARQAMAATSQGNGQAQTQGVPA